MNAKVKDNTLPRVNNTFPFAYYYGWNNEKFMKEEGVATGNCLMVEIHRLNL